MSIYTLYQLLRNLRVASLRTFVIESSKCRNFPINPYSHPSAFWIFGPPPTPPLVELLFELRTTFTWWFLSVSLFKLNQPLMVPTLNRRYSDRWKKIFKRSSLKSQEQASDGANLEYIDKLKRLSIDQL